MKPTGATKEATNHSPLPWKAYPANDNTDRWYVAQDGGAVPVYGTSITGWGCVQQSRADAELIVTAVNERERLREALQQVRDTFNDHVCNHQHLCMYCIALESADAALNDATTSTSAGEGE